MIGVGGPNLGDIPINPSVIKTAPNPSSPEVSQEEKINLLNGFKVSDVKPRYSELPNREDFLNKLDDILNSKSPILEGTRPQTNNLGSLNNVLKEIAQRTYNS